MSFSRWIKIVSLEVMIFILWALSKEVGLHIASTKGTVLFYTHTSRNTYSLNRWPQHWPQDGQFTGQPWLLKQEELRQSYSHPQELEGDNVEKSSSEYLELKLIPLIDTRTVRGHKQAKSIRMQKLLGKRNNWMGQKRLRKDEVSIIKSSRYTQREAGTGRGARSRQW